MATFAKKEKEKKKAKKKQDKTQKKEDRKTNNNKGKSLEDLIMYVDENGNFSKTPVAASETKSNSDDNGAPKEGVILNLNGDFSGTIDFISDKGFGFIVEDISRSRIYMTLKDTSESVTDNDRVTFQITRTARGNQALNIRKTV